MAYKVRENAWQKGEIITANDLNNIEEGIQSALNNLSTIIDEDNDGESSTNLKAATIKASGNIETSGNIEATSTTSKIKSPTIIASNTIKISDYTQDNADDKVIITNEGNITTIGTIKITNANNDKISLTNTGNATFTGNLTVGTNNSTHQLYGNTTIGTLTANNLTIGTRTEHTENDQTTYTYAGQATFNTEETTIHGITTIDTLKAYSGNIGIFNLSLGRYSVAIGQECEARNDISLAFGHSCEASSPQSMAIGEGSIARSSNSFVFGKYNIIDSTGVDAIQHVEIVGGGTDTIHRENIRTLDWNGNEVLRGGLTADSINIGYRNQAVAYSGAIGFGARTNGYNSVSVGNSVTANGRNSIALGAFNEPDEALPQWVANQNEINGI